MVLLDSSMSHLDIGTVTDLVMDSADLDKTGSQKMTYNEWRQMRKRRKLLYKGIHITLYTVYLMLVCSQTYSDLMWSANWWVIAAFQIWVSENHVSANANPVKKSYCCILLATSLSSGYYTDCYNKSHSLIFSSRVWDKLAVSRGASRLFRQTFCGCISLSSSSNLLVFRWCGKSAHRQHHYTVAQTLSHSCC